MDGKEIEVDRKLGHQIKTVPIGVYSSKSSLEASDTFVRIVLFKPMQAVVIESVELAQSVKKIFEMVWSSMK